MIQSSRLHHWLPLPQVPILKGRSSEPLPSRGFVYLSHITPGGTEILYSTAQCILEHETLIVRGGYWGRWLDRWFQFASTAGFQRLAAYLPGLVCLYRQVGLCSMTREAYPSHLLCRRLLCFVERATHGLPRTPYRRLRRMHVPRTRVNKGNSPHLRVGGVSAALLAGCSKKAFGFVNHRKYLAKSRVRRLPVALPHPKVGGLGTVGGYLYQR
jgi:hypothetical protein